MCSKINHHSRSRSSKGHRHHGKHKGVTIISPERYVRKRAEKAMRIANEAVAHNIHVPYERAKELADIEMRTGKRQRFDYGSQELPRVPAGPAGGNGGITLRRGTVAAEYISSNTAPDRTVPRTIETQETLLKMNGRLERLRDSLERKKLRWKQGISEFTLEEKRELEELEKTVAQLQAEVERERLLDAGSEEAAERSQEIQQYALRNGLSWAEAKERLYPLRK